jgi:hypothetical protein
MRAELMADAVEGNPLANAILKWIVHAGRFDGTATELKAQLEAFLHNSDDHHLLESKSWPRDASWLGRTLGRLMPGLRHAGVACDKSKDAQNRTVYTFSTKAEPGPAEQAWAAKQGGLTGGRDF